MAKEYKAYYEFTEHYIPIAEFEEWKASLNDEV